MTDRILVIGNTWIVMGLINHNNMLKFVPTTEVSGNEKANNVKYLPYKIVQIQPIEIQSITFVWLIIKPNTIQFRYISQTRRLCVFANTKLYHQNLLLWISMKFWILVSTTLGLFSKDPPIYPNTHTKLTKIKIRSSLGQFKHCSESLI